MKLNLIEGWKQQALRLNSVQWMALWSAVVTTWLLLPDKDQAAILSLIPFGAGERVPALMVLAGFLGGIYARLRAQPALHAPQEPQGRP